MTLIINIGTTGSHTCKYELTITSDVDNMIRGTYIDGGKKKHITARRVTRYNCNGDEYITYEVKGKLAYISSIID